MTRILFQSLIFILVFASCTDLLSKVDKISKNTNCDNLFDLLYIEKVPDGFSDAADFRASLRLDQKVERGFGGAEKFFVTNRKGEKRFLKIFPKLDLEIDDPSDIERFGELHGAYREIDLTCRLSESQNPNFLSMNTYGKSSVLDPFESDVSRNGIYPFFIAERLYGPTLFESATKPESYLAQKGYFNINKATEREIKSILFQTVFALIKASVDVPGFRHNDLHPDNMIISTNRVQSELYSYEGQNYYLEGPEVKIIDYGISSSQKLVIAPELEFRPTQRMLTDLLMHYLTNEKIGQITAGNSRLNSAADVSFFSALMFALQEIPSVKGKKVSQVCASFRECIVRPFFDLLKTKP